MYSSSLPFTAIQLTANPPCKMVAINLLHTPSHCSVFIFICVCVCILTSSFVLILMLDLFGSYSYNTLEESPRVSLLWRDRWHSVLSKLNSSRYISLYCVSHTDAQLLKVFVYLRFLQSCEARKKKA